MRYDIEPRSNHPNSTLWSSSWRGHPSWRKDRLLLPFNMNGSDEESMIDDFVLTANHLRYALRKIKDFGHVKLYFTQEGCMSWYPRISTKPQLKIPSDTMTWFNSTHNLSFPQKKRPILQIPPTIGTFKKKIHSVFYHVHPDSDCDPWTSETPPGTTYSCDWTTIYTACT